MQNSFNPTSFNTVPKQIIDNETEHSTTNLDSWLVDLLADPITKQAVSQYKIKIINGVIDARVHLKNSYGYTGWEVGQHEYERWETAGDSYKNEIKRYQNEIAYDKPIYEHFKLSGTILDVGGGAGTVREFLPNDVKFVSIDPFINVLQNIPQSKKAAYKCLSTKLNFIASMAEFLPFQTESFDWVHMRSMLDHVQVPDLALIEANRVLKNNGKLLVGLYVDGGKSGRKTFTRFAKDLIKDILSLLRIDKWKDHHTWHPSYTNLLKLIRDNNFKIEDVYWQPHWNDTVCYILASKPGA